MRTPRGIFVRLVRVFLLVGVVPFLGVGLWTWHRAKDRMTDTVTEYWLVRLARETASEVDRDLAGLRATTLAWADEQGADGDLAGTGAAAAGSRESLRATLALSRRAAHAADVALALIVAADGRVVGAACGDPARSASRLVGRQLSAFLPEPSDRAFVEGVFDQPASRTTPLARTWHRSSLLEEVDPPVSDPNHHEIAWAAPVLPRELAGRRLARFALVVFFRFDPVQRTLDDVQKRFSEWVEGDASNRHVRYGSGYPFMFDADGDTIIAHKKLELLGTSIVRDHRLNDLHDEVAQKPWGFARYEFPPGNQKISGFARCAGPEEGGFGWTVGVGIDHADIYADVSELRDFLVVASLVVTGLVILLAAVFSARLTEPLTRLIAHTQQVARGNLDARVTVDTKDEFAVLAEAFNRMTADLRETNQRLIQAEKDAAWREMARQVAHEIKNPLTPIMLSAEQIGRAWQDRHPELGEIIEDSVRSVVEQCQSLKRIAQNFASYAAFPLPKLEPHALAELVRKATQLYAIPRPGGATVVLNVDGAGDAIVLVDQDEIRRVLLNLFNNAFEAMAGSGTLTITALAEFVDGKHRAVIRVSDTGRGIPGADLQRLFEPYFSTRTGGTGLGLAICRKIMAEHGGSITVHSEVGAGTTFALTLPAYKPVEKVPRSAEPEREPS